MDWPTRFGVVVGYSLSFTLIYLVYDHRTTGVGVMPLWMVAGAPVVGWLAVETAGRLRRARGLGGLFGLVGLAATGVWWWWLYSLSTSRRIPATDRYGLPTLFAVTFLAAALFSGRLLSRRHRGRRDRSPAVDELEPSNH